MSSLPALYERFHAAILAQDASTAAPDIADKGALTIRDRLSIYIEGYRLRLSHAVAADYPALRDYIGTDAFDWLALDYIEAHPPAHFNLDRYGFGFAPYVEQHNTDPFARDLARLEGAIAEIFMGEESEPLTAADIDPETFAEVVFRSRAASRLLRFDYPVHEWLTEQRAGTLTAAPRPEPSFCYLYRHTHEVQREPLPALAYELLMALFAGQPLGAAFESVPDLSALETQSWFGDWLGKGFFAR